MSSRESEFGARDCAVLGISTDDVTTHTRWLTTPAPLGGLGPLQFPLAADVEGETAQKYGVYLPQQRAAMRGLFVIDPNGVLQYQVVHSLSVGRSVEELLRVLDALQSGGLCPGERPIDGPHVDVLAQLQPGRIVGSFRIERELGRGAFGTVVQAEDTLLRRTVALKFLQERPGISSAALLDEARAAAALNHPNVCAVHGIDMGNGMPMIVMEFVPGKALSTVIGETRLSPDQVRQYAAHAAAGLAAAHDAGVVHGDLKPANLMVTQEDSVKIMDFGLARRTPEHVDTDETLPPQSDLGLSGTLSYLAPERARGAEPAPAADTFAWGLVLYEMLTGVHAIQATNALEALNKIESFSPQQLLASVPSDWHAILLASLDPMPENRRTMRELHAML